jgi:hypothetical protein
MEWEPITIVGRKVRGRNRQYSGLLNIDRTARTTKLFRDVGSNLFPHPCDKQPCSRPLAPPASLGGIRRLSVARRSPRLPCRSGLGL